MERFEFPALDRSYMVANFVQTLDGKIQGPGAGYWPIGSADDLAALLDLRAQCDGLIHGRQTALGHRHLERLSSSEFQALLAKSGHTKPYSYIVLSAHPDAVLLEHIAPAGRPVRVVLVTPEAVELPVLPEGVEVWRIGRDEIDLPALRKKLHEDGLKKVDLEAGPQLFGAFVAAKLVDELFLTIAPKLFGTSFGTPTMIGGRLFEPDQVPQLTLVSSKANGDELYLRYRFNKVMT